MSYLEDKHRRQAPKIDLTKETKIPPHNLEAECGALGCLLLAPGECIPEIIQFFSNLPDICDVFYDLRHQTIFAALRTMYDKGNPIDTITLHSYLKARNELEPVGGLRYLNELEMSCETAVNLPYYLNLLKSAFVLRRMIATCTELVNRAENIEDGDVTELISEAETAITKVGDIVASSKETTIKEYVHQAINELERDLEAQGKPTGILYGFRDIDKLTRGGHLGELTYIAARTSVGKAQPLDAKILTPTGFVEMRDMQVGSQVIGKDGKTHSVTGVFPQGKLKTYRVLFSDGTSTVCCGEHLWFTHTYADRAAGRHGSVKSTVEIIKTLKHRSKFNNHAIPVVDPVRFSTKESLPLHPWLLGALIGDGCLMFRNILFTKPEDDVQSKLISLLPPGDIGVSINGMDVRIKRAVKIDKVPSETMAAIRKMGLSVSSEAKFIPKPYLFATPEQRLQLLQGLLDTDGYVTGIESGCSVEFATSSKQLSEDVRFLVRSLGGICREPKVKKTFFTNNGKKCPGKDSYVFTIRFLDQTVVPVTSKKHLLKFRPANKKPTYRAITKIEECGFEECQCIAVDAPDHLYVTNDFIVTHNTALALNIAEAIAVDQQLPTAVFEFEMTGAKLAKRLLASRARVNLRKISEGEMIERDFGKITKAAGNISYAPLYVFDKSGRNILEFKAIARRLAKRGVKVIIVDYIQLMRAPSKRADSSKQQEISDVSNELKSLTLELNIHIIALAQLNRDIEKQKGRKPMLSDLKQSGSLEEDADNVFLLYRILNEDEDDSNPNGADTEPYPVGVIMAKNRNGPTGEITLTFIPQQTRFEDTAMIDPSDYEERPKSKPFSKRPAPTVVKPKQEEFTQEPDEQ